MKQNEKKTRKQLEEEFIKQFTPSNLIEKITETFGDRHEHIDFDDFMPLNDSIMNNNKKILKNSINNKKKKK